MLADSQLLWERRFCQAAGIHMNAYSSIRTPAPYLSKSPQILKDLPEFARLVKGFAEQEPYLPIPCPRLQLLPWAGKKEGRAYLLNTHTSLSFGHQHKAGVLQAWVGASWKADGGCTCAQFAIRKAESTAEMLTHWDLASHSSGVIHNIRKHLHFHTKRTYHCPLVRTF